MKKIILICAVSLVVGIVLAVAINLLYVDNKMPKNYSGANDSAVIVESKETTINAPRATVLEKLKAINSWSEWNKSVSNASIKGDFTPGTKFSWDTESGKINSQVKVVQDDKIVWVGKTLGIFAIHEWTFEEVDGKTKVTSKESWEGLTVFVLQAPLRGQLGNSLTVTLTDLKSASEKSL